jgi:hypothetical protein
VQSIAQPDPHGLLKTAIKYVRQHGQNLLPPHKIGCEGAAGMFEWVCKAAEQVLADHQAKVDPRVMR